MKKMIMKRTLALTLTTAALFSSYAFADTASLPLSPAPNTAQTADQEKAALQYQLVNGKITSIQKETDYTRIELENDDMGFICNVADDVFVLDQKDQSYKKVSELTEGTEVAAVLSNNAPMTMSLPPMTNGVIGFVVTAEPGFLELSVFDHELVNTQNTLKLNIGEETKIVDAKASKRAYGADDLKNSECLVFYTASTRSIPAQTTPQLVMILASGEEAVAPEEEKTYQAGPLRELAEKNGYTIAWTANDKPVVLEKESCKIELTVGSKFCSINGVNTQMDTAPYLQNSKIMIGADYAEVLAKY